MISRKISNFAINNYTISRKIAGMKSNIFDNMIAMMEKYANNLEMLVNVFFSTTGSKAAAESNST